LGVNIKMDEIDRRIRLEILATLREKYVAINWEAGYHGCPAPILPETFEEIITEMRKLLKEEDKNIYATL
jgi:hypothetical protein